MTNLQNLSEHSILDKFLSKVKKSENCWNWDGTITSHGYGHFKFKGKIYRAHRVSYFLFKGHIPYGMYVCHACDNRMCVNPNHLWLGTAKDNAVDMSLKNRGSGNKTNHASGDKSSLTKVSDNQVNEISELINNGVSQRKIAKMYGVRQTTISYIKNNRIKSFQSSNQNT